MSITSATTVDYKNYQKSFIGSEIRILSFRPAGLASRFVLGLGFGL